MVKAPWYVPSRMDRSQSYIDMKWWERACSKLGTHHSNFWSDLSFRYHRRYLPLGSISDGHYTLTDKIFVVAVHLCKKNVIRDDWNDIRGRKKYMKEVQDIIGLSRFCSNQSQRCTDEKMCWWLTISLWIRVRFSLGKEDRLPRDFYIWELHMKNNQTTPFKGHRILFILTELT